MEDKNTIKVSLSTVFLIIAIIVIIIMGMFMFKIVGDKAKAEEKVENLNGEVSNLEGKVNDLQGKINSISNTINSNNTSKNQASNSVVSNNTTTNSNVSEEKVLEKGTYIISGMEVTPDPEKYGIYSITINENNKFSIDMPLGTSYIGSYTIEGNNIVCKATNETNQEGGGNGAKSVAITFKFEIIDNNNFKYINADTTGFELTKGMKYRISK